MRFKEILEHLSVLGQMSSGSVVPQKLQVHAWRATVSYSGNFPSNPFQGKVGFQVIKHNIVTFIFPITDFGYITYYAHFKWTS